MASKTETWIPEIEPLETIGEFRVESESNPGHYYMVDLFAYDGMGSCTCPDHQYRTEPALKASLIPVHETCKHIDRCYAHAGREFVKMLLKKIKSGSFKRR
jgi:hypothetical protein